MRAPFLGIATALAAMAGFSAANAEPTVILDGVTIEGAVSPFNPNVDNYYGIPYAATTRWSRPWRHAALSNPFDASSFSTVAACPQPAPVVVAGFTLPQSEDCLSLSVHVPASANATSNLPVLVWIHGGSLQTGSGVGYFADNMIAATGIVVVTINYRLGALGWLAQKALEAGSSNRFEKVGDAGNYGLMDQQFALRWVKRHIAAFGGDPRKVTIGGESAGGLGVSLHLASTATAAGLFRGAIVESGAYAQHELPPQAVYETRYGDAFVNAVLAATGTVRGIACNTLTTNSPVDKIRACLKGATVATLLQEQQDVFHGFGISPDTGTLVVPNGLQQAFSTGDFIRVPVLQGSNRNEGRFFEPFQIPFAAGFSTVVAAGGPANYDLANGNAFCGGAACTYGQEINLFLSGMGIPDSVNTPDFDRTLANTVYPLAKFPDFYLAGSAPSADEGLAQVGTDYSFACNALDADTELAKFTTVYAYEFDDPLAPPIDNEPALTAPPNDQYGYPTAAEHEAELQFLFAFPFTGSLSTNEQQLEAAMWGYWTNFVKTLNPNRPAAVPHWPAFNPAQQVQTLVPGPAKSHPLKSFPKDHACTLWEPIISTE